MWEWLKGVLPDNIQISPTLNLNIQINSNNTANTPVELKDNNLIINGGTPKGKIIANKVIEQLPQHMSHNDLLIEEHNLENYNQVDKVLSTADYDNEFSKFRGAVPIKDLPVLEIAILVKIKHDANENVATIKSQAIQRYGQRAGMICNLYTAGYFHTLIKPLYDSIEKGEIGLDEYLEVYEMFVTESPLAMFIGLRTNFVKAKTQLLEKIDFNKEADIGYLNIHGIGTTNINLINKLLKDGDISASFIEEPSEQRIGNSIKVTIYF